MDKKAVIALGGNAIIKPGEEGAIFEQFVHTRESLGGIEELIRQGYKLAITHGNGPQVGNLLIQQMAGIERGISPLPLGILNAATEGTMGYMIEQSLQNRLHNAHIDRKVMTIITQIEVSADDPSIANPSKPIGPFYTEAQATKMRADYGWTIVEDAGRGWRQVVASPMPISIPLADDIATLVNDGRIVIACGGGGIPFFVTDDGELEGFDAVIDKDFASALLAELIGADLLVILTAVHKVAVNFGKPDQRNLDTLTLDKAKAFLEAGEFPAGSMGPKMRAAIHFLERGGNEVLITSIEHVVDAMAGKTGTRLTR
ncbi:MAG: carbamate kinase [Candidatus Cloacimonetes bacterium]|nr:carbamate kinase [Candidatus Cloacimonadota bacterium]